ncbi:ROK family transcriptional regulator [Streptomyces sp. NPDC058463]|uniref:ROK family transcriptional regulator n=1 Tax=Streptomyces sp. NPDC058463 TaxID=3346510 RepID=UPI003656B96E
MPMGTNHPGMGSYNQAVVLEAIQTSDGISRVQIADRTGLTAQTVSVIVRRLLGQGLVREGGTLPSTGGKPRTILRIDPDAGYAIGIHFDPAEITVVLANLAGIPVRTCRRTLTHGIRPAAVIAVMARAARSLLDAAQVPDARILGVGLACPGPLDADGTMYSPPQLNDWDRIPLRALLEEATGFAVAFDNDATAAAIGERWAGAGRSVPSYAYLYFGTGIGGGLILDHQIYRGRSFSAAEFGHLTVVPGGAECYCGNRGCLEAECSPAAIEALHAARTGHRLTHAGICAAFRAGDADARGTIRAVAALVADAAVSIVNLLDVDLLLIGGPALRETADAFRDAMAEAVDTRSFNRRLHDVRVEIAPMGADAAAIGAASLVFHSTYAPTLPT